MTISSALEILDREILRPKGIKLSVGFKSSKLSSVFPAFFGR